MIRSIALYTTRKSVCRCFSTGTSSSALESWERSARAVKNTDNKNKYLESIRQEHDPALHIKTLEEELRGTMGKALGKQGQKVLRFIGGMKRQQQRYEKLLQAEHESLEEIRECVIVHNQFRKDAQHARWELMVQRQAVGLLVNNQKYVHEMYPIDDALPLPADDDDDGTLISHEKEHKEIDSNDEKFGNQLDWWQRVGRWR